MDPEHMNRKLFLKLTLTGVATGVLAACSGDDPESTGPTTATVGGTPTNTGTMTTTGASTSAANVSNNATTTGTSTVTGSTTGTTGTTGSTGTTSTTGGTGTSSTTGATGTTGTATSTTGATGTTGVGGGTGTGTGNGNNTSGGGTGNTAMCTSVTLTHLSTTSTMGPHDHLPLSTEEAMAFVTLVNDQSTAPLEWAGGDMHSHTITFTADEIMMLANGGTLSNKVTDADEFHTHTYDISCA